MDKKKAETDLSPGDVLLPAQSGDAVELDELWSFVFEKVNKVWIWVAQCRRTRQIAAYHLGDRSEESCRQLWNKVPPDYKECRSYSDFWDTYEKVINTGKHQCVGKESGQTNHIERWNNTLRQRLSRFVRKTLSFSKMEYYHEMNLRNFIFNYNNEIYNNWESGLLAINNINTL